MEQEKNYGMHCAMAIHNDDRVAFIEAVVRAPCPAQPAWSVRLKRLNQIALHSMADALEMIEDMVIDDTPIEMERRDGSASKVYSNEHAYKMMADHFRASHEGREVLIRFMFD